MGVKMSNCAVDANGDWRVDRRLLAASAAVLSGLILAVWPVNLIPGFLHDDAVIHFSSGVALTLGLAALIPVRDDLLGLMVAIAGVVWEPFEWWWVRCHLEYGTCVQSSLTEWMSGQDTLADMALVALGALVALRLIGRYR